MLMYSFKNLIICFTLGFSPFILFVGLLSLIGVTPIYFNNIPYYGFKGFALSILISPLFGFMMATMSYLLLNIGRFILIKFFKKDDL